MENSKQTQEKFCFESSRFNFFHLVKTSTELSSDDLKALKSFIENYLRLKNILKYETQGQQTVL